MYLAVYRFGPRWKDTVVHNSRLMRSDIDRALEEQADKLALAALDRHTRNEFVEAMAEATKVDNVPLKRWRDARPDRYQREPDNMSFRTTGMTWRKGATSGHKKVSVTLDLASAQDAVAEYSPAPSDIAHAIDELDRQIGPIEVTHESEGVQRLVEQPIWRRGATRD